MRLRSSPIYQLSPEQFLSYCQSSQTLADIIRKCGLRPDGNYETVKRRIKEEQIDISHIPIGQGCNTGRSLGGQELTREEFVARLSNDSELATSRGSIKSGLIKFKILDHTHCALCPQTDTWNQKPLRLQLDHINGDSTDNRLINLRFLCPNCHSQTETFGKGTRKRRYHVCSDCKKATLSAKSVRCRTCDLKRPVRHPDKISWPTNEELTKLVWLKPRTELAKEWGVSSEIIGRKCKARGINQPPRGYWNKRRAGKTHEEALLEGQSARVADAALKPAGRQTPMGLDCSAFRHRE